MRSTDDPIPRCHAGAPGRARRTWLRLGVGLAAAAAAGRGLSATPVRVAVEPWPPWIELPSPDQRAHGLSIEIFDSVAARLGVVGVMVPVPFARALQMLEEGTIDVMPMLAREPEREPFTVYSAPVVVDEALVCGIRQPIDGSGWAALPGQSVSVTRGYSYGGQRARLERHAGRVVEAPTDAVSASLIANGRVDRALLLRSTLRSLRQSLGERLDGLQCAPRPLALMPLHFGISRRSVLAAELVRFDAALAALMATPAWAQRLRAAMSLA